ncbi:MAG TPA: crossover junction endodeoxyribonuclease RuvC [Candidatus Saccharimonadales bacterium]|nr:crossover junction endodeoxyribonuclease RuvC [Candidatus Saccharimonadales bacterium]
MRIIGIDPGTGILGFGVIDAEQGKAKLVDAGVVRTEVHQPLDERLEEIYTSLCEIIKDTKPQVMVVEKLFFSQNITTAISVSHARGVAMLAGKLAGLTIIEYTPLQIKQALTGYGRADKNQIQQMVKIMLGLKEIPKPDDCADALAAALMHATALKVK